MTLIPRLSLIPGIQWETNEPAEASASGRTDDVRHPVFSICVNLRTFFNSRKKVIRRLTQMKKM